MEATTKQKKMRSMKVMRRTTNAIIYVILVVISIIWLFPFFYLIIQSLRGETGNYTNYFFPKKWTFDNYIHLFTNEGYNSGTGKIESLQAYNFMTWYGRTFLIAVVVTIVQTVIVLVTSYALSRMRFKMRKPLMNLMLILGMFPGFMSMTALYFILKLIGLTGGNATFGLILVYVGSSCMGYYICKGFFDTIPKSLDEAARIDGASRQRIFFKIILPLSKPIIVYTLLTAFMGPWGDYMFASLIIGREASGWNVAVGMYEMIKGPNVSTYSDSFQRFCAAGVVVSLPITILFFILQRYYVEGVTGGSVKG